MAKAVAASQEQAIRDEWVKECKRQYDNCLYTSTAFLVYLKFLRGIRLIFSIIPIFLSGFGAWSVLSSATNPNLKIAASICTLLGGLIPLIVSAGRIEIVLEECKQLSGDLTNLKDLFRQAALITSKKGLTEFEIEVKGLMARMEKVRSPAVTPLDFFFWLAQRKIKSGDYDFDIDLSPPTPPAQAAAPGTPSSAQPQVPTPGTPVVPPTTGSSQPSSPGGSP